MTRDIRQIVNDQVSVWQKRADLFSSESMSESAEKPLAERPKVVAIATQMGANGRPIGARAGALLSLPNFDRDILQHIADSAHVSVSTIETLDEHARNRVEDYISSLLNENGFNGGDHLRTLGRVVAALWEHGPCVLTGHGCIHIVPRECALTVRLIAPQELRIARVAKGAGITYDEARRHVQESDKEREAFHRRYFKVQVDNPMLYDLILNTGSLNKTTCAQIIATAYASKFDSAGRPTEKELA